MEYGLYGFCYYHHWFQATRLLDRPFNEDRRDIRELLAAFDDPRYIRIHGRPVFLVYQASRLPEPAATGEIWREEARRHGIGDLYW